MIKLGSKVKDKVTGLEGIAICRSLFLNGCVRITVQSPVDKDGKVPPESWFDEEQIEVISEGITLSDKKVGGPGSNSPPTSDRIPR